MAILTVTDTAKEKIESLCKDQNAYAVLLNIKGGGCAGFEYEWGFMENDSEIHEHDEQINLENGNLVIGKESVMFLIGSIIDYKNEVFGSMFTINNPGAASQCGCGTSFSYDFDFE